MRNLLSISIVLFILVSGYSRTNHKDYDELTPGSRQHLSTGWLEAGKAYLENGKSAKAKKCFIYADEYYPMGNSAQEARDILGKTFQTRLVYNPGSKFQFYVNRAESMEPESLRLNNYLMALEIKPDKDILHKTAIVYMKSGNKEKAKEYSQKAIAAGFSKDSLDPGLKNLEL